MNNFLARATSTTRRGATLQLAAALWKRGEPLPQNDEALLTRLEEKMTDFIRLTGPWEHEAYLWEQVLKNKLFREDLKRLLARRL